MKWKTKSWSKIKSLQDVTHCPPCVTCVFPNFYIKLCSFYFILVFLYHFFFIFVSNVMKNHVKSKTEFENIKIWFIFIHIHIYVEIKPIWTNWQRAKGDNYSNIVLYIYVCKQSNKHKRTCIIRLDSMVNQNFKTFSVVFF